MSNSIIQNLVKAGLSEQAKYMCIKEELDLRLASFQNRFYDDLDLDLNPHLTVKFECLSVARAVANRGFSCTWEDVMLFWLTKELTDS